MLFQLMLKMNLKPSTGLSGGLGTVLNELVLGGLLLIGAYCIIPFFSRRARRLGAPENPEGPSHLGHVQENTDGKRFMLSLDTSEHQLSGGCFAGVRSVMKASR